jgi:hypothetical protein
MKKIAIILFIISAFFCLSCIRTTNTEKQKPYEDILLEIVSELTRTVFDQEKSYNDSIPDEEYFEQILQEIWANYTDSISLDPVVFCSSNMFFKEGYVMLQPKIMVDSAFYHRPRKEKTRFHGVRWKNYPMDGFVIESEYKYDSGTNLLWAEFESLPQEGSIFPRVHLIAIFDNQDI